MRVDGLPWDCERSLDQTAGNPCLRAFTLTKLASFLREAEATGGFPWRLELTLGLTEVLREVRIGGEMGGGPQG